MQFNIFITADKNLCDTRAVAQQDIIRRKGQQEKRG